MIVLICLLRPIDRSHAGSHAFSLALAGQGIMTARLPLSRCFEGTCLTAYLHTASSRSPPPGQEIAGASDLKIEVYLVLHSLLALSAHHMEVRQPGDPDHTLWGSVLAEALRLMGMFVLDQPTHRPCILWGRSVSILQQLSALSALLAAELRGLLGPRAAARPGMGSGASRVLRMDGALDAGGGGEIKAAAAAAVSPVATAGGARWDLADLWPLAEARHLRLLMSTLVACCLDDERE